MPGDAMTLSQLYTQAQRLLPNAFEADQLFYHVTGLRRYDLPMRGEAHATAAHTQTLLSLCERRKSGEPLQYILGEWEFFGLPFLVGSGVLIPRADTETPVSYALELLGDKHSPCVVDLCSGSGCIAVTLSLRLPRADVTAVELSPEALPYLRDNISRNDADVRVVQADAFTYTHPRSIDLLISNPPYIPRHELETLQPEVRREPPMALDGGGDGLDFYRLLADRYADQLAPGGILCVEVGIGQSGDVSELFEQAGLSLLGTRRDLGGVIRAVAAQKQHH